MADTKISALPAATTPLAGTETLPVVQSGATKKVAVSNLTAGRQVAMAGCNSSDNLLVSAGKGVAWVGNASVYMTPEDNVQGARIAAGGSFLLSVNGGNTVLTFDAATKNGTWSLGNLVQGTAAKGINFTANTPAAGMTSQLLNWYEEGTWTPTYSSFTLGGAQTTLTATYTRIGRCVYIQATFRNATSISCTQGVSYITGYPFTPGFSTTIGFVNENTAASIGVGELYAANGRLYPPNFTSGANEVIVLSGFYIV